MNIFGSYLKLLSNSKQSMIASIELYNKPQFPYREEVFVILLVNAWELLLLAILSHKKKRIFQKKIRDKPYKTLKFFDAFKQAKSYFPENLTLKAVEENLNLIKKYRDNAIHYYNSEKLPHCMYVLAQAAIINYREIVRHIFNQDLADRMNLVLLPLSFGGPPNFVEFFKNRKSNDSLSAELINILQSLEKDNVDTRAFITHCNVNFQSSKKIDSGDLTATIVPNDPAAISVNRPPSNPDDSYPFLQSDIIGSKNKNPHHKLNKKINSYTFQAISWKNKWDKPSCNEYYYRSKKHSSSPRYSQKALNLINDYSDDEIKKIEEEYKGRSKNRKK
jgi:hypothetical protein